jgi:hypothetical protein
MIEQASLIIGDGNWAVKSDSLLGYALPQGKYTPREMSVVRATTGTRVNAEGLVEVVPYNLVQYSEQFDNAYWVKSNSTATANSTTAPNGTLTADTITITSGYGSFYIFPFETFGNTLTYSCYFKKGTANTFYFESNPSSGYIFASYNLDTEVISPSPAVISSSIENVGNGWYRCSLTAISNGSSYAAFGIYQPSAGLVGYVWGAQINEGSLKDYLPTTTRLNIARIDYSTGSPALLVEPQRTNTLQYSSQFDNAVWEKYRCDIGINAQISPSGIQDADTMTSSVGETILPAISDLSTNFIGNTRYSASLFVKKIGTADTFKISYVDNVINFAGGGVTYNVVTQAITITQPANNSITASIEDYGNGWYRLIINFLTIATPTFNYIEYSIPTVSTTNTFALWGAQIEAGAYSTSYIPTTSASVTRNADQVLKTGISSLIGTEFTLFYDGFETTGGVSTRYIILKGSGGTYANAVFIEGAGLERIALTILDSSNATIFNAISSSLTDGQRFKLAVRFKNNDFAFYVNGSQVATQASGIVPTFSDIYIGYYTDYSDNYSQVNSVAILKTALTNTQLASLTTL